MKPLTSFEDLITLVLVAAAFMSFIGIVLWAMFFADKGDGEQDDSAKPDA